MTREFMLLSEPLPLAETPWLTLLAVNAVFDGLTLLATFILLGVIATHAAWRRLVAIVLDVVIAYGELLSIVVFERWLVQAAFSLD
ncbi:MAG: hypothetical protein ACI93T_002696, partial [Porticoccaceae bacterium]